MRPDDIMCTAGEEKREAKCLFSVLFLRCEVTLKVPQSSSLAREERPAECFCKTWKRLHLEHLVSDPVRAVAVQLPCQPVVTDPRALRKLAVICGCPRHKIVFSL